MPIWTIKNTSQGRALITVMAEQKQVVTDYGEDTIRVPRDREASFEPILVPKHTKFTQGIENAIISLYAKGMSNADIEEQIREIYEFNVSDSTISKITDKINSDIVDWQNRPPGESLSDCLDGWYCF